MLRSTLLVLADTVCHPSWFYPNSEAVQSKVSPQLTHSAFTLTLSYFHTFTFILSHLYIHIFTLSLSHFHTLSFILSLSHFHTFALTQFHFHNPCPDLLVLFYQVIVPKQGRFGLKSHGICLGFGNFHHHKIITI